MSPAKRRSQLTGGKPKKKARKSVLPMCRCLSCHEEFRQPYLNYVYLDCPKCRKKKSKK
jgi:Zn finger protein HypA/HybF involved in hydrogenase expression